MYPNIMKVLLLQRFNATKKFKAIRPSIKGEQVKINLIVYFIQIL